MTNLSALMAGFAMASFLQFGFEDNTVSVGVLVGFGLTTSVVVRSSTRNTVLTRATDLCAGCLLPHHHSCGLLSLVMYRRACCVAVLLGKGCLHTTCACVLPETEHGVRSLVCAAVALRKTGSAALLCPKAFI